MSGVPTAATCYNFRRCSPSSIVCEGVSTKSKPPGRGEFAKNVICKRKVWNKSALLVKLTGERNFIHTLHAQFCTVMGMLNVCMRDVCGGSKWISYPVMGTLVLWVINMGELYAFRLSERTEGGNCCNEGAWHRYFDSSLIILPALKFYDNVRFPITAFWFLRKC